jgi:hypothetical protein
MPGGDNDDAALSDEERAALADLEAALARADPNLGHRLRLPHLSSWSSWSNRHLKPGQQLAVGGVAAVVGLLIVIATFTVSLWAALPGLAIVAGAIWLVQQGLSRLSSSRRRPRPSR